MIAAIVVGALGWNLTSMDGKEKKDRWTDSILPWGSVLAMDQNWGMFAPSPPDSDQWFIIKCTSPSGKEFELFRNSGLFSWEGSEVSFDPPVPFHKPFYNHRWCKYWEAFMDWDYREIRPGFRAWLCREYNRRQTDPDNKCVICVCCSYSNT